jgi:uncharacterized membrane protein YfcA
MKETKSLHSSIRIDHADLMLELGLLFAVVVTSTISGVLGMAGGLILMGVYGMVLPVGAAMILHGVTQLASNGFRAFLSRKHIAAHVLLPYTIGALACMVAFLFVAFVPDQRTVFLALGALPFLGLLKPKRLRIDVTKPGAAAACGFIVTAAHLLAGVSGPLLDVFFIEAPMDRHSVIATKAVTQTFGHLMKLVFYGGLASTADLDQVATWIYSAAIGASFAGTYMGQQILTRVSDEWFRATSARVLMVLGAIYLVKGLV